MKPPNTKKIMKQTLILLILITFSLNVKADYSYMSLSSLVCRADYGAIGTIIKIDNSFFFLKVENYVLNKLEFDTLKIQKFEDWTCGRRYKKYEIGQKELVFFRKSNYVIDDYDLLGYGAGGEFELPIINDTIYYKYSYSKLKPYLLKDFLLALKDFDQIKQKTNETSNTISNEEKLNFASKSELHKIFIECGSKSSNIEFDLPKNGYIANLEKGFLYQDYENKIYIFNFDIDSIFLHVDDAEMWKQDDYFIVKPKDAWTRRWLNVYSINDTGRTKVLYNQLFEVLELPEPRIYFGSYYSDTIYGRYEAIPSVANYLDNMHKDNFLEYELLSYTYIIKSFNGVVETYKIKSARGTPELHKRIRKLEHGDKITLEDVYVLYPNRTVKKISGRTVIVGKSD